MGLHWGLMGFGLVISGIAANSSIKSPGHRSYSLVMLMYPGGTLDFGLLLYCGFPLLLRILLVNSLSLPGHQQVVAQPFSVGQVKKIRPSLSGFTFNPGCDQQCIHAGDHSRKLLRSRPALKKSFLVHPMPFSNEKYCLNQIRAAFQFFTICFVGFKFCLFIIPSLRFYWKISAQA